jgi:O-antigen/teichoic acid export membrane protein|tara:strand:- start:2421 stop:3665 length:1245 start_codon:yes stop_codon:yes gene_type:complete
MRLNSYILNFVKLLSGNVFAQILPFIFAPFIARMFKPELISVQGNFMAIVGIIAIIAGGRYDLAIVLPKKESKASNLAALAIIITLIVSFLSLVLIFFKPQIGRLYENEDLFPFIPFIALGVLLSSMIAILTNWLVRQKAYTRISLNKIIQSISINGLTTVFGYYKFGVEGLIGGWIIGQIITFLFLFYYFNKRFDKSEVSKKKMKEVGVEYKEFPLVNTIHSFSDLFFSQFVLFALITREFGAIYLGLFFMMNRYMKAPIRVVGSAAGQVYYKEANDKKNENEDVRPVIFKSIKIILFFAIPVCLLLLFFGQELFGLYLGKDYILSGKYAQIMAIPIFFNFLVSPISTTPLIYKKQKQALAISLIGYIVSIIALGIGIYLKWDFEQSLILFAIALSMYYIYLLFWYISLTKKS